MNKKDTITEDTITEDTITEDTITDDTITEDTITEDTITEDTITEDTITEDTMIDTWDDLKCDDAILRGIYSYGFEKPSTIQKKTILPFSSGVDIIAQAQSGTGKTGCFIIGTLMRINCKEMTTQAIILSPTRELSIQTYNVFKELGCHINNLNIHLLIGGTCKDNDIQKLKQQQPHVLICCAGRIIDMLNRQVINTKTLKLMVLDEADEMLSYGFKEQIYDMFQFMPSDIQVALFSATLPDELEILTKKFMRDPFKILVKPNKLTLEGIKQYYIALENDEQKYDTLKDIYELICVSQSIIYCNSVHRVQRLYENMKNENFPVCQIHSGMDKIERTKNYDQFKLGKYRVLISSDVTSRGIDIQQVSTVINYDITKDVHKYLHRIGRSGRWGRKGISINLITNRDTNIIKQIETHYDTTIEELPMDWNENY
jgi:superfamily II DNA/RNA helicase